MPAHLRLLRIHQWVKNLFTLAPPFLAGSLFSESLTASLWVFLAFCLASSTVYVLNDFVDAKADRAHPKKKLRPIAANEVGSAEAMGMIAALASFSILCALQASVSAVFFAIGYMALNVAYSFWIKRIPIMDGVSISTGFTLRLLGGGPAIGVGVSPWIICSAFFAAFAMALVKRRIELVASRGAAARPSLRSMTPQLLDTLVSTFLAASLALYCAWVVTHPQALLLFSLMPLAAGVSRFLWLAYQNNDGEDFSKTLLGDWPMLGSALAWTLFVGVALGA